MSAERTAESAKGRDRSALTGEDPGDGRARAQRLGGHEADPGPPVKQVGFVDRTLVAEREDKLGAGHLKPVRDRIRQGRILAARASTRGASVP